ncbi:hypothetical protein DICPUDRAFT_54488 [Dictyostelium purpureum]|uniref:SET domain-containing protein n=1 Tax=Dictyostelium purpureum TaxID=5786 RepID=F0ZH80_DICPU|nr:uncharacterized protein DICPUDRAFT_54488 [Dictyostelium purpureum]EGC36675.1 hypothetical protein DICPUDRAFT_54488 [Dictyostelium purpureum]|eukprot:XP_003286774.1 hypothetical protein DICPUDRAFT_54488 [Dictyostelium purpureum]
MESYDKSSTEVNEDGVDGLVKEFEKEGMKLNSKRVSLSSSTGISNTPPNTSPPINSSIQLQQQSQQSNFNPLSVSNNLMPQISPFILGYAREDMSKDDELAIIPSYLMPLHPFACYHSLNFLLDYFKQSCFYPNTLNNNNNANNNSNKEHLNKSLNEIIDNKLQITEALTKVIYKFIYNEHPELLSRLSISIDDFVMLLFLVAEYYHNSIIDPLNNTSHSLKKLKSSSLKPAAASQSSFTPSSATSSTSKSNVANYSYYEILNNLINISTPLTKSFGTDSEFQKLLNDIGENDSNNNEESNSSNFYLKNNYLDLSNDYIQIKEQLELIFKWIVDFIGFKLFDNVSSQLSGRDPTTLERVKLINQNNVVKLKSCLFKCYNYIKIASIVNITLPNISFKGFLPLPHYLIQSNIYKPVKKLSTSTPISPLNNSGSSLVTSGSSVLSSDGLERQRNLFLSSLEQDDESFSELVAVLKNKLYKDSPISLENIEIITLEEFNNRTKNNLTKQSQQQQQPQSQQHPLLYMKQYNYSSSSLRQDDSSIIDDYQLDLFTNEELLLYYGYTSLEEEMGFIRFEIQVFKSIEQLEKQFTDQDELDREIRLMKIKKSILESYLGDLNSSTSSIITTINNSSAVDITVSTSSFKSNKKLVDTITLKRKEGYYLDFLSQENILGYNLLELTRLSKLREVESYFYEEGQLSKQINLRNEMETLVYLSKQLKLVLIRITSKLNLISTLLTNNSRDQLTNSGSIGSYNNNNIFLYELEKYYKSHLSIIEQSVILLSNLKNQFTKPTIKSVPFIKPTDEIYRRFENWLKQGGVQFPKLQIANFTDSTGRGVVTTKKVDEDEVVVSVPRKYLINVDVAKSNPILGPIFEELHLNDETILFLFVIYEKENPNTFWRPFYDTLPSYFTTSIHYSSTELLELEGTNLFAETLAVKQQLQAFRDYLFPELSNQYPDIFPESVFSWENFLWARSLLDSRAIQLKIDGKIKSCLVPMADMINHHTNAQISERHFDQDSNCFRMVSSCNIPANNQIFLHYGALQNSDLALYYGFVIPNNIYDSFHVGYELEADEAEEGEESVQELKKQKDKLLIDHNLSPDSNYLRKDRIPTKNFACLRVILLTKEEFNPYIDIWNPINLKNETAVLQTLYQLVLMLLKSFSSTYQEDQQLLEVMINKDNDSKNNIDNESVDSNSNNNNNNNNSDNDNGINIGNIKKNLSSNELSNNNNGNNSDNNNNNSNHNSRDEDDEEYSEDDSESTNSENDLQSSEQMRMVLQYRIEQKQILTSTIEKIVLLMEEMGLELPQSPEASDQEYDDDQDEDFTLSSDNDEYFSDTNENDD